MNDYFDSNNMPESMIFTIGELKTLKGFASVVKKVLEKEYPYANITIAPHTKNNNLHLLGLTIADMNYNMAPTIYLDSFFQNYKIGRPLKEICEHISNIYSNSKSISEFPIDFYTCFENISGQICYKLINYKANKNSLQHRPYVPYLDFAIVFYIMVSEDNLSGHIDISNNMMNTWQISSAFDLFHYAHENTEKLLGFSYGPMLDFMQNLLPVGISPDEWDELFENSDPYTYIATTNNKSDGACCILFENALEKLADAIGGNFYILPSSLHEMICIPYSNDIDVACLRNMVIEVNCQEVRDDEILSDHVYLYNEVTNKITICQ